MNITPGKSRVVPEMILDGMARDAASRWPDEACGVITRTPLAPIDWTLIPMVNADPSGHSFRFNPLDQVRVWRSMERRGDILYGIYHSHPYGLPYPSEFDQAIVVYDTLHFIVGRKHPGLASMTPAQEWVIGAYSINSHNMLGTSHQIVPGHNPEHWFSQQHLPGSTRGAWPVVWEPLNAPVPASDDAGQ